MADERPAVIDADVAAEARTWDRARVLRAIKTLQVIEDEYLYKEHPGRWTLRTGWRFLRWLYWPAVVIMALVGYWRLVTGHWPP
jgi:hypothetical protein